MAEPWAIRVSGKMQKETHNASSKRNSAAINKMGSGKNILITEGLKISFI